MNIKLMKLLTWLFGIASLGFLISGLICEYIAIWVNQWAKPNSIGLLSDQLQTTAFLNIIMFLVLGFMTLITIFATDTNNY